MKFGTNTFAWVSWSTGVFREAGLSEEWVLGVGVGYYMV